MIEQCSAILRQTAAIPSVQQDATNRAQDSVTATMLLDGLGNILSCAEPAEKLFGASRFELMGRWISDFILGLLLEGRSPSYDARYLAHLCQKGGWREFVARDVRGLRFAVELNLSRMVTRGQEIILLNVRRSGETPCP
jgi:PAS domain S-box-containing protein